MTPLTPPQMADRRPPWTASAALATAYALRRWVTLCTNPYVKCKTTLCKLRQPQHQERQERGEGTFKDRHPCLSHRGSGALFVADSARDRVKGQNQVWYVMVMQAAKYLPTILPMMMTPAGTLKPAKVFVIGAGVAGLQAIATAKRLGAQVTAFDTRSEVAEQVRSVGAKFLEIDLGETGSTKDGDAKELTPEQLQIQRDAQKEVIAASDVVITTAQVFGRKPPVIVPREFVEGMKTGSVVIDMAAETGGNVDGSQPGEVVDLNGVKIVGTGNWPNSVPRDASQMYASNLYSLIDEFWDKEFWK